MGTPPDDSATKFDIVLAHSPTKDGRGVRVLRARDGRVEAGEIRPLVEGKPITSEVIQLRSRGEDSPVFDAQTLLDAPRAMTSGSSNGEVTEDASWKTDAPAMKVSSLTQSAAAHKGPARVSSDAYRSSWDRVFGTRSQPSELQDGNTKSRGRRELN